MAASRKSNAWPKSERFLKFHSLTLAATSVSERTIFMERRRAAPQADGFRPQCGAAAAPAVTAGVFGGWKNNASAMAAAEAVIRGTMNRSLKSVTPFTV